MNKITLIDIGLAKNIFHLHAVDDKDKQMKVAKLSLLKLPSICTAVNRLSSQWRLVQAGGDFVHHWVMRFV